MRYSAIGGIFAATVALCVAVHAQTASPSTLGPCVAGESTYEDNCCNVMEFSCGFIITDQADDECNGQKDPCELEDGQVGLMIIDCDAVPGIFGTGNCGVFGEYGCVPDYGSAAVWRDRVGC